MTPDGAATLVGLLIVLAIAVMFAFGGLGIIVTAGRKDADPLGRLKKLGGIALVFLIVAIVLSERGVGEGLHNMITGAWANFLHGVVRPVAAIVMDVVIVVAAIGLVVLAVRWWWRR